MRGGYPGHGETYESEDRVLWWSHGGKLKGESWKRFRFLYDILCETPGLGLTSDAKFDYNGVIAMPQDETERANKTYFIYYYSFMQPSYKKFDFEAAYEVEVIDTWNMTIEKRGVFQGKFRIDLSGRPYMAIRFKKVK